MKNNKISILVLFANAVFAISCKCNYIVTKEYLKSNCKIEQSFYISHLRVDSLNGEGIPISYEEIEKIMCAPVGRIYYSPEEKEFFKKNRIIIDSTEKKFKPQKKVYFFKKNQYYNWWSVIPYKPSIKYEILPLEFKNQNWYLVSGLMRFGNPDQMIFVYIDQQGNLKALPYYKPGNW